MLLDAIIVAILGAAIWRGARRGLLRSLTGLIAFVLATAAAVFGFRLVAAPLEGAGVSPGIANLAGALTVFIVVLLAVHGAGRVVRRGIGWTSLRHVDRAGGAAVAGFWALSWVTAVLLALSVIPAPEAIASQMASSSLSTAIVQEAPRWMRSVAHDELQRALSLFIPDDTRKVAIVATTDFRPSGSAARAMFDLLNAERAAAGASALRWDETLARAALAHAADMYRNGYFDHTGLDGSTPGQRLERAGARFAVAGENIALAPSTRTAHARLMGSVRHRAHILDVRFTRVGIAVLLGRQGLLIAEEFAG